MFLKLHKQTFLSRFGGDGIYSDSFLSIYQANKNLRSHNIISNPVLYS